MAYLEAAGGCSLLALGKPQAVDKSEDAQSARWQKLRCSRGTGSEVSGSVRNPTLPRAFLFKHPSSARSAGFTGTTRVDASKSAGTV